MLIWVLCVFVSILVHELGHALTARSYGWHPEIVLHAFGGYASYFPTWRISTFQRVAAIFAGPGAGFILYGLVVVLGKILVAQGTLLEEELAYGYGSPLARVLGNLRYINLFWGLFNLLPVYPLDGGQITRELLRAWKPWGGVELSLKISLVCGAAGAFFFFNRGQTFAGLLFASMAFENLQSLQTRRF
jgi:Zn-dependent protease